MRAEGAPGSGAGEKTELVKDGGRNRQPGGDPEQGGLVSFPAARDARGVGGRRLRALDPPGGRSEGRREGRRRPPCVCPHGKPRRPRHRPRAAPAPAPSVGASIQSRKNNSLRSDLSIIESWEWCWDGPLYTRK